MFYAHEQRLIPRKELHNLPCGFQVRSRMGMNLTFTPINHGVYADLCVAAIKRAGHVVVGEQWILSNNDAIMYGSLDILPNPALALEIDLGQPAWASIGVVHSNEQGGMKNLMYCGATVGCCLNTLLTGSAVMNTRNSKLLDTKIHKEFDRALERWAIDAHELTSLAWRMRSRKLTNQEASWFIMEAANMDFIATIRITQVWRYWLVPRHAEFQPSTMWSLYNAFTEMVKDLEPRRQLQVLERLRGHVFRQIPETTDANIYADVRYVDMGGDTTLHGNFDIPTPEDPSDARKHKMLVTHKSGAYRASYKHFRESTADATQGLGTADSTAGKDEVGPISVSASERTTL